MNRYILTGAAAVLALSIAAGAIATRSAGKFSPRRFIRYTLTAAAVLLALIVPFIGGALLALLRYARRLE